MIFTLAPRSPPVQSECKCFLLLTKVYLPFHRLKTNFPKRCWTKNGIKRFCSFNGIAFEDFCFCPRIAVIMRINWETTERLHFDLTSSFRRKAEKGNPKHKIDWLGTSCSNPNKKNIPFTHSIWHQYLWKLFELFPAFLSGTPCCQWKMYEQVIWEKFPEKFQLCSFGCC